jgi:hypothetical protein
MSNIAVEKGARMEGYSALLGGCRSVFGISGAVEKEVLGGLKNIFLQLGY